MEGGGGEGGLKFSVQDFFLVLLIGKNFISPLHEKFLRYNCLQEFFFDKYPLKYFFFWGGGGGRGVKIFGAGFFFSLTHRQEFHFAIARKVFEVQLLARIFF